MSEEQSSITSGLSGSAGVRSYTPGAGVKPALSSEVGSVGRFPAGWFIALAGWSIILATYHLHGGADFETTDCWVAQTAREMLEAGEWIIPQFSGEIRMHKSPGPYWAVMLSAMARGDGVDQVSARIPSAIGAVLMSLTVFWLGWHIGGRRLAIFSGFASSSSALFLYWSHRAASDLGLAALVSLSLAALWIGSNRASGGRQKALWMLGYFAAGLGMLYKLPMPLACVGVPVFLYVLLRNRWRVLASGWHLLGLIVFLLPWVPWVVAMWLAEPDTLMRWRVEFLDRFTGDLPNVEGQRGWMFYLLYLIPPLLYTVPYTLSLPSAIVKGFRRDERVNRDGMLFMLIWFFGLLAFFLASAGKELRYLLPALPPLFVLIGHELSFLFDPARASSPGRDRLAMWAVWIAVPLALGAGVFGLREWQRHEQLFEWGEVWRPYVVMAAIFTVGAGVSAWLYRVRRRNASFGALVVTMWLVWMWAWPTLMPMLGTQKPSINFASQLRGKIPYDQQRYLKAVGLQDPRVIWYADVRFPRALDPMELIREQGGRREREYEERRWAEEMVRQLGADEPVLFVIDRFSYIEFMLRAPQELASQGRSFPETHLWIQTEIGQKKEQFLVFSNKYPPWPEPDLNPPSTMLQMTGEPATSKPATAPAL